MRYLLAGYYGMRNVGDDVLLYATLAETARHDDNLIQSGWTANPPEYVTGPYQYGASPIAPSHVFHKRALDCRPCVVMHCDNDQLT